MVPPPPVVHDAPGPHGIRSNTHSNQYPAASRPSLSPPRRQSPSRSAHHHHQHQHRRISPYPTDLHAACASPIATPSQLRAYLTARPNASAVRDADGRLPLHVLAHRLHFASSSSSYRYQPVMTMTGKGGGVGDEAVLNPEMEEFILQLVRANPHALITHDSSRKSANASLPGGGGGRIPFAAILLRWIESCHTDRSLFYEGDYKSMMDSINIATEEEDYEDGDDPTLDTRSTLTMPTVFRSEAGNRRGRGGNPPPPPPPRPESTRDGGGGTPSSGKKKPNFANGAPPSGNVSLAGRSMHSQTRSLGGSQGRNQAVHPNHRRDRTHHSAPLPQFHEEAAGGAGRLLSGNNDNNTTGTTPMLAYDDLFPTKGMVHVPPMVSFIFRVLDMVLADLEHRCQDLERRGARTTNNTNPVISPADMVNEAQDLRQIASLLISTLASMPSLVKTLVLMEASEEAYSQLMGLDLLQRVLKHAGGMGDWLVYMLECIDETVSWKAVEYLMYLSNSSYGRSRPTGSGRRLIGGSYPAAFTGGRGAEKEEAQEQQFSMYQRVGSLPYLSHAMLALEDSNTQRRALRTEIIKYALDLALNQSWFLFVTLVDGLWHVLWVVVFSLFCNSFFTLAATPMSQAVTDSDAADTTDDEEENSVAVETTPTRRDHQTNTYMALFLLNLLCGLYLLLREAVRCRSMHKISPTCFRRWCLLSFTSWVHVLACALGLGCVIAMDVVLTLQFASDGDGEVNGYLRHLLAVACGFLWLKLLLFLAKVNWRVSAALELVRQILVDLRFLLLLLAMTLAAFAQMFYLLLSANYDSSSNEPIHSFFLSVYSLMVLGTYESTGSTSHTATPFSLVLFVMLTFVVTYCFFNALVATAVDTYQRWSSTTGNSLTSSNRTGGGDYSQRLAYVVELKALSNLLSGFGTRRGPLRWTALQYCAVILFVSSVGVIFLLSIGSIRNAMSTYYGSDLIVVGIMVLVFFFAVSVLVFLSHLNFHEEVGGKGGSSASTSSGGQGFCAKTVCASRVVQCLAFPFVVSAKWLLCLDGEWTVASQTRSSSLHGGEEDEDLLWHGIVPQTVGSVQQMMAASEERTQLTLLTELRRMEDRMKTFDGINRMDILSDIRSSEVRIQKLLEGALGAVGTKGQSQSGMSDVTQRAGGMDVSRPGGVVDAVPDGGATVQSNATPDNEF